MASANVTLAGNSAQTFVVDATQRVATLNRFGGRVINNDAVDVVINVEAATINSTTLATLDPGSIIVKAGGAPVLLPATCKAFTFKATGATTLVYESQAIG